MHTFIEKLKQKPEKQRKRIAFVISGVFTIFVALIWWFSNFSTVYFQSADTTIALSEESSPIDEIKNSASVFGSSVTDRLTDLKNIFQKMGN